MSITPPMESVLPSRRKRCRSFRSSPTATTPSTDKRRAAWDRFCEHRSEQLWITSDRRLAFLRRAAGRSGLPGDIRTASVSEWNSECGPGESGGLELCAAVLRTGRRWFIDGGKWQTAFGACYLRTAQRSSCVCDVAGAFTRFLPQPQLPDWELSGIRRDYGIQSAPRPQAYKQ